MNRIKKFLILCLVCLPPNIMADQRLFFQNQAGEIIEVNPDGRVNRVSNNHWRQVATSITNFLNWDNNYNNWEFAAAGRPFASLNERGLSDPSDWTQDRMLDTAARAEEFWTAVYYRLTEDDSYQETTTIEVRQVNEIDLSNPEEPEELLDRMENNQEQEDDTEKISTPNAEETDITAQEEQDEEPMLTSMEVENQESTWIASENEGTQPPPTSSFGTRSRRKTSPSSTTSSTPKSSQKPKRANTQESQSEDTQKLPKTGDVGTSSFVITGLLLLLLSFIVKKQNHRYA